MLIRTRGRSAAFVRRTIHAFRPAVLTCLMCLVATFGISCDDGPCVDGVQGDRLTDETAIGIKLINDTSNFVHLLGSRETTDLCNQVIDGGSRFIFVPGDRIAYTVRAFSSGVPLGEITCTLPEEQTVRFTDTGFICVMDGG